MDLIREWHNCDAIREMSHNAKLSLWSRFRAVSELFPQLFELSIVKINLTKAEIAYNSSGSD